MCQRKLFLESGSDWILGRRAEFVFGDAVLRYKKRENRYKKRENPVISDRVQISEGALKGCSEGGWRSGWRRSEM